MNSLVIGLAQMFQKLPALVGCIRSSRHLLESVGIPFPT